MKARLIVMMALMTGSVPVFADEGNEAIDYVGFEKMTRELAELRNERRISEDRFVELSKKPGVVILDTRSKAMFDQLHVEGAVHLNFSDFTKDTLEKVIPTKGTTVLIYCNNNFRGEPIHFASKMAPVALNIPTFINLHAYGYENVYELKPLLDFEKTKIPFAGNSVIKVGAQERRIEDPFKWERHRAGKVRVPLQVER